MMRGNKNRVRGIAIITVMVSLALMMAVVTEISTKEIMRYKLAINQRDALQADALAQSAVNFAQIILTVQDPLQIYFTTFAKTGVELPTYLVWELMPIDSDLLKGITDGSFFPEFDFSGKSGKDVVSAMKTSSDEEIDPNDPEAEKKAKEASKPKDVPVFGPYEVPTGGYGGFLGRFSSEIKDDNGLWGIVGWQNLPGPRAKLIGDVIYRALSRRENQVLFDGSTGQVGNISPSQIVGNIYDYISDFDRTVDVTAPKERWGKDLIGDKRAIYADLPGISPKNAPFDSLAELRLVPGVTDAIYKVLTNIVSVYAQADQKINLLSVTDKVLPSIFYACAKNRDTGPILRVGFDEELVAEWNRKKSEGGFNISAEGVINFLEANGVEADKDECNKIVGTESKTFLVKATATVGTVTRTIHVRLRAVGGHITLYQYQYL